ncbi:uncharacterized protein FOBCDRAFT_248471 [Fusarium oxysporum Fo47]|uniref:uncharacterized protein n=1 Tax=Fusarium oxysporum Fo47 TaxID=660027 RepID=UPI0028699DDD|nr:uncharacterized protein FOBCDRAFT_248471 [Fusarium oxysporum Fo47]WJG34852.1 hypothetical protein FOBCDRAFT_248471 [Fusarium oxysporum Fo47]
MYVNVYTGMWVDYSNGRITGATITLTARNGSILVAALSIFLVLVGSQFWSILTFDIHWMNTTDKITDILHFQHQATFRNAGTSIGATRELLALPFPWRRRQTGPRDFSVTILRSRAWALLALTNFCVWSTVGPFSCAITRSAGSHFLIAPGTCGIVFDNTSETGLSSKSLSKTIIADTHARGCYESNDSSAQCNSFVQKQLHGPKMQTRTALSGMASARLRLNLTADASTLTTSWVLTRPWKTEFITAGSMSHYGGDIKASSWFPSQESYLPDEDLTLVWLLPNFVFSMTPIDDPFFGFHANHISKRLCQPDNLVNIMACTDQYQVCNPKRQTPICSPVTAAVLLRDNISTIELNPTQNATARLILALNGAEGISSSLGGRGAGALRAGEKVAQSIQKLQYAIVEYPTGPTSPLMENLALKVPQRSESQNLCRSMKVPNPGGYKSFSVLALVMVLVVAGMVIIISIILEPVTNCIYNNWVTEHQFRRLQWILDGKLQLQRIAVHYRAAGKPRVTSFDDTRHTWHPRTRTASRAACMNVNKQHRGWERKDGERHRGAAPPTRSNQG